MIRTVTHGSKGYRLLEASGADVDGVGRRYLSEHRLAAIAWGVIDGLSDPREVHHVDCCRAHTAEANLEALEPREHGQITRENEAERRAVA